jgi:endonuclease/exonuclease/phosphatase family metal-dependent hydrolase
VESIFIDIIKPKQRGPPLRIGSIYIHSYAKKGSINSIMEWANNNTILMGDFNAHSQEWSRGKPNDLGAELEQAARSHH